MDSAPPATGVASSRRRGRRRRAPRLPELRAHHTRDAQRMDGRHRSPSDAGRGRRATRRVTELATAGPARAAGRRAGRSRVAVPAGPRRRPAPAVRGRRPVSDLRRCQRDPAARLSAAPRARGAPCRRAGARSPETGRPGAGRGADRRGDRGVRRLGRDHDGGSRRRAVQRTDRALRPEPSRGRAGGHAQLDVGPAAGLVLLRAGRVDRRPAAVRHPRPVDRHPLRRPAGDRAAAHLCGRPQGAAGAGPAGRRQPGRGRLGAAPARPPRLHGQGGARHVPVPLVLRARRHAIGGGAARSARLPGRQPRRGRGGDQPGLRHPGGLRRSGRRCGARRSRLPRSGDRPLADVTGDDRLGPARGVPGREPRRRGALVPARLPGRPSTASCGSSISRR
jgi:hypothetical protein